MIFTAFFVYPSSPIFTPKGANEAEDNLFLSLIDTNWVSLVFFIFFSTTRRTATNGLFIKEALTNEIHLLPHLIHLPKIKCIIY